LFKKIIAEKSWYKKSLAFHDTPNKKAASYLMRLLRFGEVGLEGLEPPTNGL
jgi:hypothetical protein